MGEITPLDVVSGIDSVWDSVPHPVLVVDRGGMVRTLSASARSVLPDIGPGSAVEDFVPSWLSGDDDREARTTELPDGEMAWWLLEDSARSTRLALTLERERSEFLDEASAVLMAS